MKTLVITFILMLLIGTAGASIPEWVQPGTSATYDMYSAFVKNGQYNTAVHALVTLQVDSVTEERVVGTTYIYNPTTGMTTTQQSSCPEGDVGCFGRFWVDPNNPTASFKGETGVPLSVAESGPFEVSGRTWDATTLSFSLPGRMETYIIFETETGLILSQAVKYPTQEVYMYLNSVNYN